MKVGRPREFDTDAALEQAMRVFWLKGYEGASMSDLTEAMGIGRPSLYAAFGDKEALFRAAVDRYSGGPGPVTIEALQAPACRTAIDRFLRAGVERTTDPSTPPGCLLVQGALVGGPSTAAVREELAERRRQALAAVRDRLQQASDDDDLPADVDPVALARYVMSVSNGLAVESAGGASRQELLDAVDIVMRAWPSGPRSGRAAD